MSHEINLKNYSKQWWSEKTVTNQPIVEDPIIFWDSIFSLGEECKSIPFKKYDFYHDCIVRHSDKNTKAIISKTASWSYADLHELVSRQIPLWKGFGLEIGKRVALVLPQGVDFVVALMTALRLGLTISILPLDDPFIGRQSLLKEIKRLDADAIVTLPAYKKVIENALGLEIDIKSELDLTTPSHAYSPSERVFDILDTNEAFLCPLRDSLLTLPLKRGTLWARPLSSILHDEPFATLTALLAGSTIFHISDQTLLKGPDSLKNEEIEILGVSSRLLRLWTEHPEAPHQKLHFWYKSSLLGNLMDWENFTELNTLKKISSSDFLIQPERGGITLASQPKPYAIPSFLHPSLGIPWKLLDLNGTGDETWEGVGYFDLNSKLILGETQGGFVISKAVIPTRDGDYYPIEHVEQSIEKLEFVIDCIIVDDRNPKDLVSSRFTLLIFISPDMRFADTTGWEKTITLTIKEEVGEAFLPDRILFFHSTPTAKVGNSTEIGYWVNIRQDFFQKRKKIHSTINSINLDKPFIKI